MPLNRIVPLLLLVAASAWSEPTDARSIPDVLQYAQGFHRPLWIAARAALTHDGELRPDWFLRSVQDHFKTMYPSRESTIASSGLGGEVRAVADSECGRKWSPPIGDYEGPKSARKSTATDLWTRAAHAVAVYDAVVVEAVPGFVGREPGTLVRADIKAVFKKSKAIDTANGLLVFHNYARFGVGPYAFCVGSRQLAVGDRFIVFVTAQPIDEEARLIYAPDSEIFIQKSTGTLLLPPGFKRMQALEDIVSLDDVASELGPRIDR
jgi:hypothetical protein